MTARILFPHASLTGSVLLGIVAVLSGVSAFATFETPTPFQHTLRLEEVREQVQAGKIRVVDARARMLYERGHIPGAVHLTPERLSPEHPVLGQLLRDPQTPVVVYCGGPSCDDADKVARALQARGLTAVRVFRGGWSAWVAAGMPEVREP